MTSLASTNIAVASLFRPFKFGNVDLPNRIVMAPMTRSKSPGNVPGPDVAAYYRRRAEGGVGLIVTEGTPPCPAGHSYPDVPAFYGDQAIAGWKRVLDDVRAGGGRIIPQLWHVGSFRQPGMEPDPTIPGYGPSAVSHPALADKEGTVPPVEMTQRDIDDTVAAFAKAAGNAKRLGFDGVELHGAHSYIIDQFFWSATNRRTDQYGGTLPQRTRFAVELIRAVRAEVGPDFPLLLRFSQWKQGDYRHKMAETPEELAAFLEPLTGAGVDIFHCSTRRFNDPEFEGSNLNLAGWTKKLTGKPTITVGSVGLDNDFLRTYAGKDASKAGIDALITRLENDEFDLVAVGRALLSDPAWGQKIQAGRDDDIIAFQREHMAVLT
jgi:2,4-dienoyl-CoA reductase-like NADH-dependent reductase (Old Yellow Enzyme family)